MKRDISETIGIGIILAISGGLMDAYSYICRGQFFANAQTGNILLLSISLSTGDISGFLHHFYPVVAFASGIALAILLRHLLSDHFRKHWQLSVLFVEAALLFTVVFISDDMTANSLISFACGAQVESFQRICGNKVATTMCIGNLRSAVSAATEYFYERQNAELRDAMIYLIIIFTFSIGAIIGNVLIACCSHKAIWGCSFLLVLAGAVLIRGMRVNK